MLRFNSIGYDNVIDLFGHMIYERHVLRQKQILLFLLTMLIMVCGHLATL